METWWTTLISHRYITESKATIFCQNLWMGYFLKLWNKNDTVQIWYKINFYTRCISFILGVLKLVKMSHIYMQESYIFWKQEWTEIAKFRHNCWFIEFFVPSVKKENLSLRVGRDLYSDFS